MSDQKVQEKGELKKTVKTFVRGAFLYSQDGFDYEERGKDIEKKEKVVQDKAGLAQLRKQSQDKRKELAAKKLAARLANKKFNPLIPMRDMPVDPVPETVPDNQKCERGTQEQFEYFQTYITQKQKQRIFEQEQGKKIARFLQQQQLLRNQQPANDASSRGISLVMEKNEQLEPAKKRLVRIKVTKREQQGNQTQTKTKVRVIE